MAQYYGISAAFTKEIPIRQFGGTSSYNALDWHIYSGPCATRAEAEQQALSKLGPNDANDVTQRTLHQNLTVVPKSKLSKYRINLDRVEDLYVEYDSE